MIVSFLQDHIWLFTAVVILCSAWILSSWIRSGKRKLRLPPGPPGWPILKNLPVFFQRPAARSDQFYFTRMSKVYGDIYKLEVGPQLQYVLSNIDQIREVFTHSQMQGRPGGAHFELVYGPEAKGLVFTSGPAWKALQQMTTNVFRELGVGRGMFAEKILSETQRFTDKLDTLTGDPCPDMYELLSQATCNIMCGILFGHQFNYEDTKFKKIVSTMMVYTRSMGPGALALTNKLICGLPFGPGKALRRCLVEYRSFVKDEIDQSKKTSGHNWLKTFLTEMEKGTPYFNDGNLNATSVDLVFSGTETSGSTLTFAILYLTNCPKVQSRCQRELDEFIKVNGMPSYSDCSKLPYLMAMIHEIQRLANLVPLGAPHVVEEDLELFGYDFPKGTIIVADFGSLLHDANDFPEPHEFKPERFIEAGEFKAHKNMIPFSVGRRACMGEQLARMEIFFFLSRLLHRYTFTAPKDTKIPGNLDGVYGGTRIPLPFSVVINRREN